ncbi:MAG: GAF domain-containing protein [Anaerolineales bacterium]|nr:GAF domain-containing protein [Anaerolineales bacterium]
MSPTDLFQRQRDELHILHEVALICSEATDEDLLLAQITELLRKVLFPDNIGFVLVNETLTHLSQHTSYDERPEVIQPASVPLHASICGEVVQSGKPLRIANVRTHPTYLPVDALTLSELCVPLKRGKQVWGVINAESRLPNAFSESDERLLLTVASQLTVAISNLRLLRAEARRRKEAETLQQATASLNSSLNLEEVLDAILVYLEQVVPYDSASVFLAEGANLRIVAARGFPNIDTLLNQLYPAHDLLYQTLRENLRPLYLPDVQAEKNFHGWGNTAEVRGWMCIPLLSEGQVFGCLTVDNKTPGFYTEAHANLALAFAHQAAIALQHARLFDETRRQNRELLALFDTALTLGTVLERDELLQCIGEQVYLLMAPDSMGIILYEETQKMLEIAVVIEKGQRMGDVTGLRVPLAEAGLSGWLIQQRQSMLFDDLLTETPPVIPKHMYQPARTWLGVPIFIRGQLSGILTVQSFLPQAFDQKHIQFMEAIAAQIAIALENTRSYQQLQHAMEETRKRAEELGIVFNVSQTIAGAPLNSQEIAFIVAHQFVEVLGIRECSLSLLEPDRASLRTLVDYYVENQEGFVDHLWGGKVIRLVDYPATAKVLRTHTTLAVQISDPAADPYELAYMRSRGVATLVIVPLVVKGEILGILELEHGPQERYYTPDELNLAITLANQAAMALENAQLYEELEESYLQTVLALARAMDARDTYTADHSQRLSIWAETIAREMGCSPEKIRAIHWAALLHDIGKIGVPDEILRKPGPLNDLEWAIMKQHPAEGAEIIAPVKRLAEVAPIIRAHQEKYDGTGYPDGLTGREIPLGARILAVVDSYSAMIDNRVYRRARPHTEALDEIIRLSGQQYDPEVVSAFLKVIERI